MHEDLAEPVLAVVDRTLLLASPLLVFSIAFGRPGFTGLWTAVVGTGLVLLVVLAVLGRCGLARWRGAGYALLTLGIAIGMLWVVGPFTGMGVLFGLAILFASAFMPPPAIIAVVATAVAVLAIRAVLGDAIPVRGTLTDRYEVQLSLWFSIALGSGVLLWIATRVLTALVGSLERSYARAAEVYRRETEARVQLDASRHELEELAQLEMIGRLAGGVAHDVNNALTAILAASDVLTTEVTTPDQRRDLAELEAASHHAADLVRDLLWIGRKYPASTTDVAEIGATARACLERVARVARKITIDVQLDRPLHVALSPEHLEQILFGLIVGAHRSGVTHLALTTERTGDRVELCLRGLDGRDSRDDRLRAMQIQFSVSAAKHLVGMSGGTLTMRDLDGQVLVKVGLPIAALERTPAPDLRMPMRTALVVEDEPMVLRRLCQLVGRRGYVVTAASSVADGLAGLAARPDLLITDLQLPDGSGEAIARASFAQNPARPIVICSGFSADELGREHLPDACLTFLAKPFTAEQLAAAIPAPSATKDTA